MQFKVSVLFAMTGDVSQNLLLYITIEALMVGVSISYNCYPDDNTESCGSSHPMQFCVRPSSATFNKTSMN
jgi:hypothetical protein